MHPVPQEIFKAYDIRGIVSKTLTPALMERIGRAVGGATLARGGRDMAVGRDGRLSGTDLAQALIRGLRASGVDVLDLGMVTTPMAYFAGFHLNLGCAAMVTGSHNPPDYNGLKLVIAGETLSGEAIQDLRRRVEEADYPEGQGGLVERDVFPDYLARVVQDVKLSRPMKIVVDAGNGIAGAYAPALYRALGCEVTELYCEVDGSFPNHHPDPSVPANLTELVRRLKAGEAEIGLAFDGDGDRLGVVAGDGSIIYPDRLLMLLAEDVLERQPGARVVYDVKSTRNLDPWVRRHGGEALIWKTGHSLMKAYMKETAAALGGEVSGHLFFQERWYGFDDGLYAGARLLEILSRRADPVTPLISLPDSFCTPELHLRLNEGEPHRLMRELAREARFEGATRVIDIDGLRVEYADGFGLMRPSNTTPVIVLRFEADSEAALFRIQRQFRAILAAAAPRAVLPF